MVSIHHKRTKGFTILELMIVITIAAILGALALPEMQYTLRTNKVRTSASEMHLSLLLARSEAIKRNADITITQTGSGWQVKSGATVIRQYDALPDEVSLACNGTCPASLTYNRTGRALPTSTEFRFYMDGTKILARCVVISLSGKPRVYTDNDDDYTNGCT